MELWFSLQQRPSLCTPPNVTQKTPVNSNATFDVKKPVILLCFGYVSWEAGRLLLWFDTVTLKTHMIWRIIRKLNFRQCKQIRHFRTLMFLFPAVLQPTLALKETWEASPQPYSQTEFKPKPQADIQKLMVLCIWAMNSKLTRITNPKLFKIVGKSL